MRRILPALFAIAHVIAQDQFTLGPETLVNKPNEAEAAKVWKRSVVAFENVNVVPMDFERILEQQTVLVRDGRITEMGEAREVRVPAEAVRIEGGGKYLIPGLTDMHAHVYTPEEFSLYLAHGVTTICNMWGRPAHLRWKKAIATGTLPGPTIYTCGPIIFRAETSEEAVGIVHRQADAGYDAIKIYNQVSKVAYPVLVETARKRGLLVIGHIPAAVGLGGVLEARQAIAHAEEYIYTAFEWNVDDESKIPAVAAATRAAEVPVILTLVFYDHMRQQAADLEKFLGRPELKYLPPWATVLWGPGLNRYNPMNSSARSQRFVAKSLAFQKVLSRSLHQYGVRVLPGTDAMTPGAVPGFSLLEELRNFAELGMTPFEVLRAATRYPAEFLSPIGDFGTVAPGKRADLILLDRNPLKEHDALDRRVGVMANGVWRTEAELQAALTEIPERYSERTREYVRLLEAGEAETLLRSIDENDPFEYATLAATVRFIKEHGMSVFRTMYADLKKERPDAEMFAEVNMQGMGRELLTAGKVSEAVEILKMNEVDHPRSAGACISLAEAMLAGAAKDEAIIYYQKALKLDPSNVAGTDALKKLLP